MEGEPRSPEVSIHHAHSARAEYGKCMFSEKGRLPMDVLNMYICKIYKMNL